MYSDLFREFGDPSLKPQLLMLVSTLAIMVANMKTEPLPWGRAPLDRGLQSCSSGTVQTLDGELNCPIKNPKS